jgi:hypothetical protein
VFNIREISFNSMKRGLKNQRINTNKALGFILSNIMKIRE